MARVAGARRPTAVDLADLRSRGHIDRVSVTEQVADVLREQIASGRLAPGTQLSEEAFGAALGVSRNTLREAFRLLAHEGLIEHRMNRGVFIPVIDAADAADLFRVRRALELSALDLLETVEPDGAAAVDQAVRTAETAAASGDWIGVGTANLDFHAALVALAGSPRMNAMTRTVLAQMRLVFQTRGDQQRLHEPYVPRNRQLADLLLAGDIPSARAELARLLDDGERALLATFTNRRPVE